MSKAIAVGIVGVTISFAMLGFGYMAGSGTGLASQVPPPASVSEPSAATGTLARADIEAVVRSYLLENPEILTEMQDVLEVRAEEEERQAQQTAILDASDDIFNADYDGIIGNPEGSVTIVEFFDYNCGYCKRAVDDMQALVAEDPELRFVLKEFPILGPDSQRAHVVSMAFRALAPEAYADFHRDLMLERGRATEETAIAAAIDHGVDEDALRAEMENPAITQAFDRTYELANTLNITGTPSYVVGDEVVFGALGRDVLGEKIELARN